MTEMLGRFPPNLINPLTTDPRRLGDSRRRDSEVYGRPDQTPPRVVQEAHFLLRFVAIRRRFGDALQESRVARVHASSKAHLSTARIDAAQGAS